MGRKPTDVFSEWAKQGRDEGMAKGHKSAVNQMLSIALKGRDKFSFIDAGCGNGWVVRQVAKHPKCISAKGVDGSKEMIKKAASCDSINEYLCSDLESWCPKHSVDIVHSMEVIYYLNSPSAFLQKIYKNWLSKGGVLIVGLDFYYENPISHSWPEDCGISNMKLFTENDWVNCFIDAGFKKINSSRFEAKKNWGGTLIISGYK